MTKPKFAVQNQQRCCIVLGGSTASHPLPFSVEPNGTLAQEGQDFRLLSSVVTLRAGQSEAQVTLLILDDQEPEGQEVFFIYLSHPQGHGVQIAGQPDPQGYGAYAKIIIHGKKEEPFGKLML